MKKGKRRLLLITIAALIVAVSLIGATFLLTNHQSTTTVTGKLAATYVTSSAPNSSQWLIVKSTTLPSAVTANNTGMIPQYSTLSALNQTRIGVYCVSVSSNGECLAFKTFLESGWYYDSTNQILYIHYVGDSYVKLSIYE